MKIKIVTRTEEEVERRDYRDAYQIIIDDKDVFFVSDGEPEDANLSRNFNDVYELDRILEEVFAAGKRDEDFTLEYIQKEEI